jgi:serine/threonine-protein kinase
MVAPGQIDINEQDLAAALGAVDEIELLGRGAFGTTFRVLSGDDEYAIKIIHFPNMPDYMWEREVEVMKRVDHPNLLSLRSSGMVDVKGSSLPYWTSEYVEGGNLRSRIDQGEQPSSSEEVVALLTGLLAGIGELHDLGGLHRDIKPENVALREGDWGQPVLLDFGLARLMDMSTHTVYPAFKGTPRYMSPEQLRLKPARTRSDLFAVGVTVYEAGTGEHPYAPKTYLTAQDLHDLILNTDPRPPDQLNPAFGEPATNVVLRLMSYRAHDRLGVREALNDLEE